MSLLGSSGLPRGRVWDRFLTDEDRQVFGGSGYGARQGFGVRPCLLIVDVTLGFVGDRPLPALESNKEWPDSCGEVGWKAAGHIAELLEMARAARIPIVYTAGLEPSPDGIGSGRWADKNSRWGEPGRRASANQIFPGIAPADPSEIVIHKGKPSAFFGTPLTSLLVDLGVDSIILCGTTTSGCIRATAVDAFSLNYKVSVVEECTFDRGETSHAISLFDLDLKYADVVSLGEAVAYLETRQKDDLTRDVATHSGV